LHKRRVTCYAIAMKYEHLMDRTDKAELKRAWQIIDKGKKLRNRVLSRVRMRASRTKDNT